MSVPARLKYIVLSIMFVIASVNLTRTALDILQNSKRLDTLKVEISGLENEKTSLEHDIDYKNSANFIEERARNALNLIKPNEHVFVVPSVLSTSSSKDTNQGALKQSNVEVWLRLFF